MKVGHSVVQWVVWKVGRLVGKKADQWAVPKVVGRAG
jgi:hypothetical protein